MFDFTGARVLGDFSAFFAELIVLFLSCNRLLVDTGCVKTSVTLRTCKVYIGILSAWHSEILLKLGQFTD